MPPLQLSLLGTHSMFLQLSFGLSMLISQPGSSLLIVLNAWLDFAPRSAKDWVLSCAHGGCSSSLSTKLNLHCNKAAVTIGTLPVGTILNLLWWCVPFYNRNSRLL